MLSRKFSGVIAQLGPCLHPSPGLVDERPQLHAQRGQRAIERPVGGELDPPPVGDGGSDPPRHHRKDRLDVALQLLVGALDGVEIPAEGQR